MSFKPFQFSLMFFELGQSLLFKEIYLLLLVQSFWRTSAFRHLGVEIVNATGVISLLLLFSKRIDTLCGIIYS